MYNSRRMTTYRNHNGHLLALITDNFTSKYNDSFDIDYLCDEIYEIDNYSILPEESTKN